MQSAYVLLMIKEQTESLYSPTSRDAGPLVDNMLSRLHQGLWSIWGTLVNYGAAFEALGGMRGELVRVSRSMDADCFLDQVRDKISTTISEQPLYLV